MLDAHFRLDLDSFRLDVAFTLPARGVSGVFGPSGAGKTTLLRCLAGLQRAPEGHLRIASDVWQGTATFLPPHRRAVGYVFQEADLFPHLDVRGNLRYAWRRAPRDERRITWDDAIEWLGLASLLDRLPAGLSGGERQRAAVARALLTSPRLMLMDEPLSSLDDAGRGDILPYLERLPALLDIPVVYVSHSLAEISRIADHLLWLDAGRIRASGRLADVLARSDFAAGRGEDAAVVVDARVRTVDVAYGLTLLDGPWGLIWIRGTRHPEGSRVRIRIIASDVSIGLAPERDSSIMNEFALRIVDVADGGPGEVLLRMKREGDEHVAILLARITRRSAERLALGAGTAVYARVKAAALVE